MEDWDVYCAGFLKEAGGADPMEEQRHGRYYAQELMVVLAGNIREQIQDSLDASERREWHLLGVSDVPTEHAVILFWDTALQASPGESASAQHPNL